MAQDKSLDRILIDHGSKLKEDIKKRFLYLILKRCMLIKILLRVQKLDVDQM